MNLFWANVQVFNLLKAPESRMYGFLRFSVGKKLKHLLKMS